MAEDEGEIVGFVSGGEQQEAVEGYDGELYAIYLLQSAQGKGVGRKLMECLANELHAMGYTSMVLWMLAGNDTGGFYECMGGRVVAEGIYPFRKQELKKLAYGWPDIRALLAEKEE